MTLSTKGLNWLAQNAGLNNCFTTSGVTYKDADGDSHTGGTGDVVNAFYTAASTHNATNNNRNHVIIANTTYNQFIDSSINGAELVMSDADEAWDREESGEAGGIYPQYCYTATQTCVPGTLRCRTSSVIEKCRTDGSGWDDVQTCGTGYTCQSGACVPTTGGKSETPPLQVTIAEGTQCTPGAPTVVLDVSDARPYFKTDPVLYVGVMGINVTNVNKGGKCFGYFVWEMRMWPGVAGTTCPTTEPEVTQISRFLAKKSDYKTISPQLLGTDETGMIGGSFEIPPGTHGVYTLCLSLWGNHSKQALLDELAAHYYPENVVWP